MENKKGKIITVTSSKGGVGKTTIVATLAGIYEELGYSVLILDMDFYSGAIGTYLNSKKRKNILDLTEDFSTNSYKDIKDYVFNYDKNISIIESPKNPIEANKIKSKYITQILNNVIYKYDIILIDTSKSLTKNNIILFDNSDSILYLFTNDLFDIKNTKSFFEILKETDIKNIYTVLNNSIFLNKSYFSMYSIRNIIKHNIDYTISKDFYIKNIDRYIMDAEILSLNKTIKKKYKKDIKKLEKIAKKLIK